MPVSITTPVCASATSSRILRQTSQPLIPGIMTSRTTRSGKCSRARRQASSPSEAWMTSSFGAFIVRRCRATSSSIDGSSSATSTSGVEVGIAVLSKDAAVRVKHRLQVRRNRAPCDVLPCREAGVRPRGVLGGRLPGVRAHSSRNLVGTRVVDSTSCFDALTFLTIVGMWPLVSLSFPCMSAFVGSISFLMICFHWA